MLRRLVCLASVFVFMSAVPGKLLGEQGEDWQGDMNLRYYQGVCAYVANPEGKDFEVTVDVREWNMVENGEREMLIKIYAPDGEVLVRKVVEDDGIVGNAFQPEAGGWDHEMWYYALCYSRGSVPMIRWSAFSEPERVKRLQARTFTFPVKAGKPGVYRVQMCASRDHVGTFSLKPALKYGLAGHPMWVHGHGQMFAKSYIYVPKGTIGMFVGFAEYDQPVTRNFKLTAPDGTVLWDGMAKGGLQSRTIDFENNKYDDKVLTLEVSKGAGDYMMHLLLRRNDVRLYRGKGGVPAVVSPDVKTAKALRNGAIYHDGQVFWHGFQVRFHDWLKDLKDEDFVVRDAAGTPIQPTPGKKFGWGARQMEYKGLKHSPGFVPLNGGHEAPPLADSMMHKYLANRQSGVLNVAMRDLHEGLRMITVGDHPVIGNWTGNMGYIFGTYGWHYWRPSWRVLQQSDAPEELKAIIREAMILCSDRLAFSRGIERVNGNAFSHIPIALRYAAEATQDPLSRSLADTYFKRFATEGWGRGAGISRSGDCQEHFGHDFHYGTYIIANYRAILNDLNPPEFRTVITRLKELYTYMYCRDAIAYPWGSRTAQAAGAGRNGWKGEPGPSFTVDVNDGSEWFAARRDSYYALTFHGRLAPEWLNHYFGTKMGYGGGILCQVTVPGRGTVIASTLSGKYGHGMQRYNWKKFHIHSVVGQMADGRPFVGADSEHLNAKLTGTTVTGNGEVRDRPINVTRSFTFNDDSILCEVSLNDTDFRAAYEGRGPSSAMTEAWEMIPYVTSKNRRAKRTQIFTLPDEEGKMVFVSAGLSAALGIAIERDGFGVKVVFDRERFVKLGQNNTVMIELAGKRTKAQDIAFKYSLHPYIGTVNPKGAASIRAMELKKLGKLTDLSAVQAALAGMKQHVMMDKKAEVAKVRVALAGKDLALDAIVTDAKPQRNTVAWKASTFEVFASKPGTTRIGQVFLLPSVGNDKAAALVAAGSKQKPAPQIRVQTTDIGTGYRLQALIPLTVLGLGPDQKEMMLEFQSGVFKADGNTMVHATLFNSIHAYQNNSRFGLFRAKQ